MVKMLIGYILVTIIANVSWRYVTKKYIRWNSPVIGACCIPVFQCMVIIASIGIVLLHIDDDEMAEAINEGMKNGEKIKRKLKRK